ncbi:hypothetical protein CBS101457_000937 [Exobasidium rhododendri]|nr:hypothetical protein CBS101457_000937 [Exobasidium rhododendri]
MSRGSSNTDLTKLTIKDEEDTVPVFWRREDTPESEPPSSGHEQDLAFHQQRSPVSSLDEALKTVEDLKATVVGSLTHLQCQLEGLRSSCTVSSHGEEQQQRERRGERTVQTTWSRDAANKDSETSVANVTEERRSMQGAIRPSAAGVLRSRPSSEMESENQREARLVHKRPRRENPMLQSKDDPRLQSFVKLLQDLQRASSNGMVRASILSDKLQQELRKGCTEEEVARFNFSTFLTEAQQWVGLYLDFESKADLKSGHYSLRLEDLKNPWWTHSRKRLPSLAQQIKRLRQLADGRPPRELFDSLRAVLANGHWIKNQALKKKLLLADGLTFTKSGSLTIAEHMQLAEAVCNIERKGYGARDSIQYRLTDPSRPYKE